MRRDEAIAYVILRYPGKTKFVSTTPASNNSVLFHLGHPCLRTKALALENSASFLRSSESARRLCSVTERLPIQGIDKTHWPSSFGRAFDIQAQKAEENKPIHSNTSPAKSQHSADLTSIGSSYPEARPRASRW